MTRFLSLLAVTCVSSVIRYLAAVCAHAHTYIDTVAPGSVCYCRQVADYKAPVFEQSGGMQQGMYVPKPHVWRRHFDPLLVLLRSLNKKELQNAMDRYTKQSVLLP